jgi:hypothetical protein
MSVITDETPAAVEAYLAAVRVTLADLPAAERDDLLAEVESSLREAADDTGSIGARLGSPEEFAAELRAAAGLQESASQKRRPKLDVRAWVERILSSPRVDAARRVALELAPVWWIARGYVVVVGVAIVAGSNWSTRYPAVPRLGTAEWGAAAIVVAIAASVAIGLRRRHARRGSHRAALVANVVCAVLVLPAAGHLGNSALQPPRYVSLPTPYTPPGLIYNGATVHNIYPYSRDGKLLHDVLLYDGAGNPINLGQGVTDPNRRVLTTSANLFVFNSFPIRYYEPGTVRVAHPDAGPAVKPPTILPSPTEASRGVKARARALGRAARAASTGARVTTTTR